MNSKELKAEGEKVRREIIEQYFTFPVSDEPDIKRIKEDPDATSSSTADTAIEFVNVKDEPLDVDVEFDIKPEPILEPTEIHIKTEEEIVEDTNGMPNDELFKVLQLKIVLRNISPPIWRRIQVPKEYTFAELHAAVNQAMGWEDAHLHKFSIKNPNNRYMDINICQKQYFDVDLASDFEEDDLDEKKVKLAEYFKNAGDFVIYDYDFGDGWQHDIVLEKEVVGVKGDLYPKCLAGKRACPPEDCGGIGGYESILEMLKNPNDPQLKDYKEWLDDICPNYQPNEFHPYKVFENGLRAMC